MKSATRKQSSKAIQIKLKGSEASVVTAAPGNKFKANLQKYVELHAKSKQLLEQLHSKRTGSAGFPQVRSENMDKKKKSKFKH